MTERRFTDARISAALRGHFPVDVPPGLAIRIADGVAKTPQRRSRSFGRWLDPLGALDRSRLLSLAAAVLLATAVGVGLVAGALQVLHREGPLPPAEVTTPLDLSTPEAIRAFVHSAHDRMPALPPMTISTMDDRTPGVTIRVSADGRVRIDDPVSGPSGETGQYRIFSGTTLARTATVGSDVVWVRQDDAISEDPRVFVLAALEGAAWNAKPGCSSASPDDPTASAAPGTSANRGWAFVGREQRLGRDAYHLVCGDGDVWIDAETRLVLRSEGPKLDADFQPIPGTRTVLEVTALDLRAPDGSWFDLQGPTGVRSMTAQEYDCATQPESCATPAPPWTPPPGSAHGPLASVAPSRVSNGWVAYATARPTPGGSDRARGSDLYLVREGVAPRLIASRDGGATRNVCPRFSPDGTKLAYGVATGADRTVVIVHVDPDGTVHDAAPMVVPGSGPPVCPKWIDDGTIAYLDAGSLVGRGIDGSPYVPSDRLPTSDLLGSADTVETIASPRGDWLARVADCHLVIQRADGKDTHVIDVSYCPYAIGGWSPDGRQVLLMQDSGDFTLHAVDVTDGSDLVLVRDGPVNGARAWPHQDEVSWQALP